MIDPERRHLHIPTPAERESATAGVGGRRGRVHPSLLVAAALAAVLVGVAGWVHVHRREHPARSIPQVATTGLLQPVAQELDEKHAAVQQDPGSAAAWGEYGLVLLAHGFRREAGDCFAAAEAIAPEDYHWPYYLGVAMDIWDAQVALHAYQRAVERAPTRIAVRLRLAEWLFDLRQLEECQRHVELALQQDPQSARAQLLEARLSFQRGAMEDSLRWARQAGSAPLGNRRDVHELLARIYQRLGDTAAAAAEIERTESLPPDLAMWDDPEMGFGAQYLRDASVLNTMAEWCRARGDMEGCLQRLRQIVASEPNNVIAKQKLAAMLLADTRYDEAQRFLERSLAAHPDSADLLYLQGLAHVARGAYDAAARCFMKAIELKPDYEKAYCALGQARLGAGDPAAAVAALRQAVRLGPESVEAHRCLAHALVLTGQSDEAIAILQRVATLDTVDDALERQLIDTLLAAGRRADAIRQLHEMVRRAHDPRPFQQWLAELDASQPECDSATPGKDK
jgi:tetratricopeptide (TPR) repeat protein